MICKLIPPAYTSSINPGSISLYIIERVMFLPPLPFYVILFQLLLFIASKTPSLAGICPMHKCDLSGDIQVSLKPPYKKQQYSTFLLNTNTIRSLGKNV